MKEPQQLDKLEEIKFQALKLMENAGYPLKGDVAVRVDEQLPFMGYTTEENGQPVIVVAGFALENNQALNLLIHEMSHVYRTQTGHPSHDQTLLTAITAWMMHGKVVEPYQEKILQSILNNMQDVYADDISFKIFEKHEHLNEFFMSWIHTPVAAKKLQDRWENAEMLLSAAFAQGNLERHNIADSGKKVAKAIEHFLEKCEQKVAEKYMFFKEFLVRMPEKVTEKEFEKMLVMFLSEFLKLTK
jgi:hypothetical protein